MDAQIRITSSGFLAVGVKEGNRLLIGGDEIEL